MNTDVGDSGANFPALLYLLKMMAEPRYNFFAPSVVEFLTKFIESEMDDIVVMKFLGSNIVT